jgi:hypothetical protein
VQVGDDHIDSLGDIGFFQEFLAEIGIVDKLLGHGIAHDGGIGGALKQGLHLKDDSVGESEKDRLDGLPEPLRFPGDLFPAHELGGEGFDAGKGVGLIRQPFGKSDATDPVQDQIGVAVGLFTGGPDESGGSNFSGAILEGQALLPGEAAHTEEAVSFEGFIQHLAISIFKDVEGKGAMGEEGAIRNKDCTQVLRKFERWHEAGEMKG